MCLSGLQVGGGMLLKFILPIAAAAVMSLPALADKLPAQWQSHACEDAFAARLASNAPEDEAYADAIGRGQGNDKDLACAFFHYAKVFHHGTDGESIDLDMARRNYQASAAKGHPYAATIVGAEINPDRYDYLERGANLGVAVAGLILGNRYADAYSQMKTDAGRYATSSAARKWYAAALNANPTDEERAHADSVLAEIDAELARNPIPLYAQRYSALVSEWNERLAIDGWSADADIQGRCGPQPEDPQHFDDLSALSTISAVDTFNAQINQGNAVTVWMQCAMQALDAHEDAADAREAMIERFNPLSRARFAERFHGHPLLAIDEFLQEWSAYPDQLNYWRAAAMRDAADGSRNQVKALNQRVLDYQAALEQRRSSVRASAQASNRASRPVRYGYRERRFNNRTECENAAWNVIDLTTRLAMLDRCARDY